MKKISIVIPFLNEEEVIVSLLNKIEISIDKLKYSFEIIFVDDGSTDKTLDFIIEKSAKDSKYKYISLSRNFGHQTAVSCGLKHARGDAVIVMDADLQDPPEIIGAYLDKWEEGYEVVYAVRTNRKENFIKRFFYWSFYRILKLIVEVDIPLDTGDFSLIDRKVVDVLNSMPERNRFVRGLRAWSGFKQVGIPYDRAGRIAGDSKYPFKKLVRLATDGILSFSTFPLTLAIKIGIFIFCISLFGIIFTFFQRIFFEEFSKIGLSPSPGFATIVISILFLGGIQIFFLGIIGSYIIRIYDEVKGRPNWIIKDFKGIDEKDISNFN